MTSRVVTGTDDDCRLRVWHAGALVMVVVAALLFAACGGGGGGEQARQGEEEAQQKQTTTPQAQGVTVEEITSDPEKFYGKRVMVSGQVTEMVEPPNAFAIGGGEFVGDDRLLVVGAQQLERLQRHVKNVNEGDLVQVTGEVRQFSIEEVQQDVDYGIDDEYFGDYEGDPAVLATSVVVTKQREGV